MIIPQYSRRYRGIIAALHGASGIAWSQKFRQGIIAIAEHPPHSNIAKKNRFAYPSPAFNTINDDILHKYVANYLCALSIINKQMFLLYKHI